MSTANIIVPLREWVKITAQSHNGNDVCNSADHPSPYLAACLQIALSLAEQISQAERLESCGFTAMDWAVCVYIHIKSSPNQNHNRVYEPDETQDINEQVESFLQSFGVDGSEAAASSSVCFAQGSSLNEPLPFENGTASCTGESGCETPCTNDFWENYMNSSGIQGPEAASKVAILDGNDTSCANYLGVSTFGCADAPNYLQVDSAEIQCPERYSGKRNSYTERDKLQRIFSLGLVFYELFSKGGSPPPELQALASTEGAFVSLSTLTLTGKEGQTDEYMNASKRQQRSNETGLCQLSFEFLKLIGLPASICSVIFNMLDCVYGDLSTDDCYTSMDDVASDLQYIMSKPTLLFKGLDFESLSLTGLQLNENEMLGKDEFELIQACYLRSVSGSSELAIISGSSGTGKSCLAQRVGRFIIDQGGLFLSGKFDQMQQNKPFSALAVAFDQYCDLLAMTIGSDWANLIVTKLQEALGQDSHYLIGVIPKLSKILHCGFVYNDTTLDQNLNALQRLSYLLCQFVEIITTYSAVSVTLFIDDLQWCDEASIAVLTQLLMRGYNKFFFIGSCRDDEMQGDHPFYNMIESVGSFGINSTNIKLKGMTKDTMNEMISDLLCLFPRQVRSLTDILFQRTQGNPLFFGQLILSLNRNRLLNLSLSQQRWLWDEAAIQGMKLPDNAAVCFANGINKLPVEVQLALQMLSLFGAFTKCQYLKTLEPQLNLNLIGPLNMAASEGLVTNAKESISFCHDRM
jgi:hypothetical protein